MEAYIQFWRDSNLIKDKNLIKAFLDTPRDNFVLPEYVSQADVDYPLPIGHDQTISQPSTVAIMIQALELKPSDIVFEVGTGSGWCASVISRLAKHVYTTEIIPELAEYAKNNIKQADLYS